ncbi:Cys-tRNA(Pro) deacylase [Brevibacillus laterosporus]|uniref:Cys-tRNA(Pro)/Cys-tRNA(Cys) deacylase n=1 Tax=Brevibacillus laterosporus LMG 15441 TaxID=1042163 RepID=A0A075QYH1_BRELA|nr:Cys-tRNA(Pro) deacylase [Brevibacillus laterosporus]HAS00314.1 Cys-tRNA(Pro) deacylase [Brevibacillus sp.]AIG24659.1 Cys-tRNA(Pro)/Cys-tRNA(Cys) deacylase YbaK [Brevibacillus laterosporus LMG 15441]AUM63314.1 Cys-tRNA(Pro) deacylase [Brevibacillus laterosporus]AYK06324.1 Cys-tRNA(Pro) deacylase [Brevibacillus laterosporus]PCN43173.1 aminoacyl-tRNA deacylase [Brevibacillus laterosporus]
MSNKTNACRLLDKHKVPYTVHEYEWDEEHLNAKHVAQQVDLQVEQVFKTLVLRGDKTGVIMACIPAHKELHLKLLAAVSKNKKVEMVPMKEILELTGYIRGGCSPLGTKKNYPLFIDESALSLQLISISAGKRGLQIFLNPADLIKVSKATSASLTM